MIQIAPVTSDIQPPPSVDVCVIGGGIIGVTTAMELAECGVSVALLEKGVIAGEQSSRNWGWCRKMGRDEREILLAVESMKLWREMNMRIGAETGFRDCGILYLAEDERDLARHEHWQVQHAVPHDLSSRMIGPAELERLQPGSAITWAGALYTPDEGRAEPFIATSAMAAYLMKIGGYVVQACAVRGLETKAGRVSAVVTEKGTIACSQVVLAGGAWSSLFLRNIGIDFPQLTVVNSVMRTAPIAADAALTCAGRRFAFRKREDGGYTIAHNLYSIVELVPDVARYARLFMKAFLADWRGLKLRLGGEYWKAAQRKQHWLLDETSPFEEVRMLNPEPVDWVLEEALADLARIYPQFQGARVSERWAGVIDTTPDVVPVIGPVGRMEGLYIASGFSGHGFGLGPGAGRLTAELVMGETPCVDPKPFSFGRAWSLQA